MCTGLFSTGNLCHTISHCLSLPYAIALTCKIAYLQFSVSRVDLDEDGVVSMEELAERLKEVRDADPLGHEARLKQSQGQFMDKKVNSQ